MKKKQTYFTDFILKHPDVLMCPHCHQGFNLMEKSLVCSNHHTFNINKKGYVTLVKMHHLKADAVYNAELFEARRRFIDKGFYQEVYSVLSRYLNNHSLWCDMGSGEGTHGKFLLENRELEMLGLDLSKDAIAQASSYLSLGYIPLVADLANMPLHDHSVDGILNFLSPSNEAQMDRILKDNGIILKVVPGHHYFKELRASLSMDAFEATDYKFKRFEIIEEHVIEKTYDLDSEAYADLIRMTPLSQYKTSNEIFNAITIHLKVLVLKRKES